MRPDIESLCSEAHGHYEKGHYEDARRTYAAALNAAHAEPELESHVLRERVATLMAMQLPQLALGDAINSVLLSPSCDGYYGIGRTQLAMGLLANAVGMLSAASRMAPDRGDVREMLEEAQARHESQQSAGDRSTIRYDFWFPKQQPRSRDDNISWIRERIRNLAAPVECVHVGANGRSLVATEPIAKDTLIFAEFPFASGTANSSVCSSCFRELPMPHITCEHCEHERYCSTSCQVRAWQQYHRKLCTRDERLAQLRVYCREKHSKEDASTLMLILRLAGIALSAPEPSGPENGVATPPPPENLADVLAHPGIAHFQNLTEVEDADLRSEAICHSLRNMDLRANDFVQLRTLFAEFLDLRAFDFEWFWNMHFIIKVPLNIVCDPGRRAFRTRRQTSPQDARPRLSRIPKNKKTHSIPVPFQTLKHSFAQIVCWSKSIPLLLFYRGKSVRFGCCCIHNCPWVLHATFRLWCNEAPENFPAPQIHRQMVP